MTRQITVVVPVEETSFLVAGQRAVGGVQPDLSKRRGKGLKEQSDQKIASMSATIFLYRSISPCVPGSSRFRVLYPAGGRSRSRTRLSPVKSSPASASRLSFRNSS